MQVSMGYGRAGDAAAGLERVLRAVRERSFRPDSTRSGRFLAEGDKPFASEALVVDLIRTQAKNFAEGEEFRQVLRRKVPKSFQRPTQGFFKPPEPPAVYMLWQHRKMETFHLARPDFKRVFMCNRYIGPSHSKDDMSIRYDTPVCRNCAAAVKE